MDVRSPDIAKFIAKTSRPVPPTLKVKVEAAAVEPTQDPRKLISEAMQFLTRYGDRLPSAEDIASSADAFADALKHLPGPSTLPGLAGMPPGALPGLGLPPGALPPGGRPPVPPPFRPPGGALPQPAPQATAGLLPSCLLESRLLEEKEEQAAAGVNTIVEEMVACSPGWCSSDGDAKSTDKAEAELAAFVQSLGSTEERLGRILACADAAWRLNGGTAARHPAAWVASCRTEFPDLHEAASRHLRYALRSGKLRLLFGDHGDRLREARKGHVSTTADACAASQPRLAASELPHRDAADYLQAGVYPLKERTIPASGVAAALARAEVARFDAAALLPRRVFNVSLDDLRRLHEQTARNIPVFVGNGFAEDARFGFKGNSRCHAWLSYFATEFPLWGPLSLKARIARNVIVPWLFRYVCPFPSRNLHVLGVRSRKLHREDYPWSAFTDQTANGLAFGERLRASNEKNKEDLRFASVNLKRLPNFSKGLRMPELLGLGAEAETSHSMLWFGQTRGHMHPDWHDNVIVQLTGEDEIIVFPSNCSSLVWGRFQPTETLREWVQYGVEPGEVRAPFFHVVLRAGEGLTIPSMSFHKVVSRHSGRVALNAFIEPRWRRMRWPRAPYSFFNFQSPFLAALRILWARSSVHLWRTRKMTAFMHTPENDFF